MKDFLWSIFGNSDDPAPPDSHWPRWPHWARVLTWYLRNPCHNLFAYRWGLVGKSREVVSLWGFDEKGNHHIWAPEGFKWNFGVSIHSNWVYPFISYRGERWEWYVGWRLPNGALGAAFRRIKS